MKVFFPPPTLGNIANFCLWDLCICCGFHLLQWVELLSRRDRVHVPQNQHAKPFGACVAKWVTAQKSAFHCAWWRQLPFPCVYENELPWGLTKSRGMFLLPAGQLRANETTLDFHKTGNYQQLSNSQPQNYSWTKLWTLEVSSGSKTQWFSYFTQFKPSWNESRFPYPEEKQMYICSFMVTLIFSPHNFIPFSHCSGTACLRKSSLVKTMSKIRQYYLLPLPPSTQWSHPSSPHNSVLINQCFQ